MPIFHDPLESPPRVPSSRLLSRVGSPTARTSAFLPGEGLLHGNQSASPSEAEISNSLASKLVAEPRGPTMVDRLELMERIKRTTSPTWLAQQEEERARTQNFEYRPSSRDRPQTPLVNPTQLQPPRTPQSEYKDVAATGLAIERPRSALHAGDFREKKHNDHSDGETSSSGFLATSPVAPWHRSFPSAALSTNRQELHSATQVFANESHAVSRARAISQSSPKSFTFLPPTSPLVQQANNTDLDQSRPNSRHGSGSPERNTRRHTFSPASLHDYKSSELARSATGTPAARHLRYGGAIPYQAHQPRRLSTLFQSQPQSNPQTPFLQSRRPSFSSEASPLQHAPMVGSYEESILRGRMSTTPSRPLDFVAKIGVLGRGNCKSHLKCPPHVTVPFPAVFYSYNAGNGRLSNNEPSPYVGLIDLEHSLAAPEESNDRSRRKRRHAVPKADHDDLDFRLQFGEDVVNQYAKDDLCQREKRKRRPTSPKAPPGGCYRIPTQGQLQIVLKNPNNTAVKLFLVPYDLTDMEPGQKTFIRQRSYSAGPIIDMPTSSRKNLGTDRPEAALSNSDDPNDRPILRYLIHLHICCPSKERYYLYKSIRVVFANRVPDGKEKLRNEIQLPEPRYSAYRPARESHMSQQPPSTTARATSDMNFRRRSAGWPLSRSQQVYDQIDGLQRNDLLPPPAVQFTGGPISTSASSGFGTPVSDLEPIPFDLSRLTAVQPRTNSRDTMDMDSETPLRTPVGPPKAERDSSTPISGGAFEKLSKGDVGYGGNAFSPVSSPSTPVSAGLLSQRLRGLDVQRDDESEI
ncbi:hypothetical protein ACN47E_003470 [Coniothyrium glycines]